jgi:hypothetical protein
VDYTEEFLAHLLYVISALAIAQHPSGAPNPSEMLWIHFPKGQEDMEYMLILPFLLDFWGSESSPIV